MSDAVAGRTALWTASPVPGSTLLTAPLGLFLELRPLAGLGPSLCRVCGGQGKRQGWGGCPDDTGWKFVISKKEEGPLIYSWACLFIHSFFQQI